MLMFSIQNNLKKCFYLGLFLCTLIVVYLAYYGYIYDDQDSPYNALLKHMSKNKTGMTVTSKPVPKSSKLINKNILKEKIKQGLPSWAMEQIEEDLSNFPKINQNDLDKYFKENNDSKNQLARFQIKNGRVKVYGAAHSSIAITVNNGERIVYKNPSYAIIHDVIEYLAQNRYIPDTDFIVGLYDYLTIPSKKPAPIFTFSKDITVPGEKDLILIPDWMNLRSVRGLSTRMKLANRQYPWKNKQKKLFWRGLQWSDSTGFRKKIAELSRSYPELIDAKFTDRKDLVPFVKPEEHLKYKYLIAIDGLHCTWERFVWHLHSNSMVFKNKSSQIQWFYKGIKPYVHYVPVNDEKSLLDKINWAELNPDKVQSIITNALHFANQNLGLEDMYHYYIVLIQEYTKRLTKDTTRKG